MSLHPSTPCISRSRFGTLWTLLAILLFVAVPNNSNAQGNDVISSVASSGGTRYYIAFPDTTTNTYDARYPHQLLNTRSFVLMIYSPVEQTVKVGRVNGAQNNVSISAGEIQELDLQPLGVPLITVVNQPQSNVLQVEAEFPVIVYAYMGTAFGTAAFTPIPVAGWGMEYYAAAWPGEVVRDVFPAGEFNYRTTPKEGPSEILIIAAHDNTQVTISPNAPLRECFGCQTVTLNAGEAYLVQSIVDTSAKAAAQDDLAGTQVRATKPIGVVSGNTRVMHNSGVRPSLGENSFKDLVAEWLSPVEQHGTEFVFTPTWDDRRQRDGLDLEESRAAEFVRVFGTQKGEATKVLWLDEDGNEVPAVRSQLQPSEFTHERIPKPEARVYQTTRPAYAVMSPEAVVRFNGTTSWGANYVGASYGGWSTYMVELVPRERWMSFAPFRAPTWPTTGMSHYLNLVTDTNNRLNVYIQQQNTPRTLFLFNRGRVPGTDLVWGSIPVNVGITYTITGVKGARFTGHVYGMLSGNEQYRPGGTKKDGDGKGASVNSGGQDGSGGAPGALHPSEYEEDISISYGYPLASLHCASGEPDEYDIQVSSLCGEMTIDITALKDDPAGLRSISMLPDSSANVRLEFVDPSSPTDLLGKGKATFRVLPINPKEEAYAVIIITDRTCNTKQWRVVYSHEGLERVETNPESALDFGDVTVNEWAGEKRIVVTNPFDKIMTLKRLSLALNNQGFVITRTEPSFAWASGQDPIEIRPGDSVIIWIDVKPKDADRQYHDTLILDLGCGVSTVALHVQTVEACLNVSDLNFGRVGIGQKRTLPLEICNIGSARITFQDPYITWLSEEFNVEPVDIDRLKGATLAAGECVTIQVSFVSEIPGNARTLARLWANTRDCRDTSIWQAQVVDTTTGVAGEDVLAGYEVSSLTPNPTSGKAMLRFKLGRSGQTAVKVYDAEGRVVGTLADERLSAGEHRVEWDGSAQPSGTYYIRIQSGEWTGTASLVKVR